MLELSRLGERRPLIEYLRAETHEIGLHHAHRRRFAEQIHFTTCRMGWYAYQRDRMLQCRRKSAACDNPLYNIISVRVFTRKNLALAQHAALFEHDAGQNRQSAFFLLGALSDERRTPHEVPLCGLPRDRKAHVLSLIHI